MIHEESLLRNKKFVCFISIVAIFFSITFPYTIDLKPQKAEAAGSFSQVVSGGAYSMALLSGNGSVLAWGDNYNGQLGTGAANFGGHANSASRVIDNTDPSGKLNSVIAISASGSQSASGSSGDSSFFNNSFSMALKNDGLGHTPITGYVYTWGRNYEGQLGIGTSAANASTAQKIPTLSGITAISAGASHALAVDNNGNVWTWGKSSGGLGNGTTSSNVPVIVKGVGGTGNLSNIVKVFATSNRSFAITSTGDLYAWGKNTNGELLTGTTGDQAYPINVTNASANINNISSVAGGSNFTIALRSSNGTVWSAGVGTYGNLGNNLYTSSVTPVQVMDPTTDNPISNVSSIAAGEWWGVLIRSGNVYSWGYNDFCNRLGFGTCVVSSKGRPIQVMQTNSTTPLTAASQASVGFYHGTVLKSDGTIWDWGQSNDSYGFLCNGTDAPSGSPYAVPAVIVLDITPPIINVGIIAPSTRSSNSSVTVAFSYVDNSGGSGVNYTTAPPTFSGVTTSGLTCTPTPSVDQITPPSTGINCTIKVMSSGSLTINAPDLAGNIQTTAPITGFVVDKIAPNNPTISFSPAKPTGLWYNNSNIPAVTLTSAGDNVGGSGIKELRYQLSTDNGVTWSNSSPTPPALPGFACASMPCTIPATTFAEGITKIRYWAIDNAGNNSYDPNPITSLVTDSVQVDKTGPAAPTTVTTLPAFSNAGTIANPLPVSWSPVNTDNLSGMKEYHIYRKIGSASTYSTTPYAISTTPGISDTNLPLDNTTYYYIVKSADNAGNEGPVSGVVNVTIDRTGPQPPTISNVGTFTKGTTVNLGWSGATDLLGSGISHYHIYRSSAILPALPINPPTILTIDNVLSSPKADTGLTSGTTYSYAITGVDNLSQEGASKSTVYTTTMDNVAPTTIFSIKNLNDNSPISDLTKWYQNVQVDLSANDNTNGSGLAPNGISYCKALSPAICSDATAAFPATGGYPTFPEGTWNFYYKSADVVGNVETLSSAKTIKIDKTIPTVSTGTSASYTTPNLTVNLALQDTASGVDDTTGAISITGIKDPSGATYTDSGNLSFPILFTNGSDIPTPISGIVHASKNISLSTGINGTYTILMSFRDKAGNVNSVPYPITLSADSEPPTIISINAPTLASKTAIIDTTFTVSDNIAMSASNISVSGVPNTKNCIPTTAGAGVPITCTLNITGSGTLKIDLTDDAGNHISIPESKYTIGSILPTAIISSINPATPTGNSPWYTSQPVDITVTANDNIGGVGIDHISYRLSDTGSWNDCSSGASCTIHVGSGGINGTDGINTIEYRALDLAGNIGSSPTTTSSFKTISIDTVAPSKPVIAPIAFPVAGITSAGTSTATPLTINYSAADATSGIGKFDVYRKTGTSTYSLYRPAMTALSFDETNLIDGTTYTYKVIATDKAGNISADSDEFSFKVDTSVDQAPTLTLPQFMNNKSPLISWGPAKDNASGILGYWLYRNASLLNGSTIIPQSTTPSASGGTNLADGSYSFYVKAEDGSHNKKDSNTATTLIETQAPVTTATNSFDGNAISGWYKGSVSVVLTGSDSGSRIRADSPIYSTSTGIGNTTYNGAIDITDEGITTITFHSIDNAGNTEIDKTVDVKIDQTAPSHGAVNSIYDSTLNQLSVGIILDDTASGVDPTSVKANAFDVDGASIGAVNIPLTLTSGTWVANNIDFSATPLSAGAYVVYDFADIAGNLGSLNDVVALIKTNTAPSVSFTTQPSQYQNPTTLQKGKVHFIFTASDAEQNTLRVTLSALVTGCATFNSITANSITGLSGGIGMINVGTPIDVVWDATTDCGAINISNAQINARVEDLDGTLPLDSTKSSNLFIINTAPPSGSIGSLTTTITTTDSITFTLGASTASAASGIHYVIQYTDNAAIPPVTNVLQNLTSSGYSAGTPITLSGLPANRPNDLPPYIASYTFEVIAYDVYGNSISSTQLTATTQEDNAILASFSPVAANTPILGVPSENITATTATLSGVTTMSFPTLKWNESGVGALNMNVTTTHPTGCTVSIHQDCDLHDGADCAHPGHTIAGFDNNTGTLIPNLNPVDWHDPDSNHKGYLGYTALSLTQFAGPKYAALTNSDEPIASYDSPSPTEGYSSYVLFKLGIGENQEDGDYKNIITITVSPN